MLIRNVYNISQDYSLNRAYTLHRANTLDRSVMTTKYFILSKYTKSEDSKHRQSQFSSSNFIYLKSDPGKKFIYAYFFPDEKGKEKCQLTRNFDFSITFMMNSNPLNFFFFFLY